MEVPYQNYHYELYNKLKWKNIYKYVSPFQAYMLTFKQISRTEYVRLSL
jgi:hypothetical protein